MGPKLNSSIKAMLQKGKRKENETGNSGEKCMFEDFKASWKDARDVILRLIEGY